jgi:DNA-binding PadR family transcriptional regulator
VTINGKIRKYYKATSKGKQALDHSKEKIRELINEVL